MLDLILAEQTWLVQRVIHYARVTGFIYLTSSQQIDWEQAVKGLSDGMALMINLEQPLSEFAPAMDFNLDPVIHFGIEEAKRHRSRGVTISMFFGMVKYFRRAFTDLVESQNFTAPELYSFRTFIIRFFDHIEMGFLAYWTKQNQDDLMQELQEENRRLVQGKAQAEAIINGIFLPVFLINLEGHLVKLNTAARALLQGEEGGIADQADVKQWPWLSRVIQEYQAQTEPGLIHEINVEGAAGLVKYNAHFSKVEDLTGQFAGLLVVLT